MFFFLTYLSINKYYKLCTCFQCFIILTDAQVSQKKTLEFFIGFCFPQCCFPQCSVTVFVFHDVVLFSAI